VFRASILLVLFTGLLIIGSGTAVWGAQLDARIIPDGDSFKLKMTYQRTLSIVYNEGGDLADQLREKNWEVSVNADSSDPGVRDLINKLNQKIANDGSNSHITNLDVEYVARLNGKSVTALVDYKIILEPTLSNYNIRQYSANSPSLVDLAWRGLTIDTPVIIKGVEINFPGSILQSKEPEAYAIISGTEADSILSANLINADGVRDQPLGNWHKLFDPTGITSDASTFGLSEEIAGFVVTTYTMGESSIREGRQVEKEFEVEFTKDKEYIVRSVESADSANVAVIGFGSIGILDNAEVLGVTPDAPEDFGDTTGGGFPIMIIYGMAGMAGIGAIAVLIFSSRKLKAEEGQGQQGIDPSQLQGYATSASSGGYQTGRGEAQLKSDVSYEQTQSVYDQEKKEEPTSSDSKKGSMPKGWKPS
jgi:hypothetical protein